MLRVAIIGCGKIADEHAQQIQRIRGARLAAVVDAEILMARQMRDRYEGVLAFDDVGRMLAQASPDVVHITTPPQSHYALSMRCLDAACHIFVEKPFTMNTPEAVEVLETAARRERLVTVDHNLQFTDPAIRLRQLVADGLLGDAPVHLESYYCYDLGDPSYAKAFLSDTAHWVRGLPGGLLQNIISHGIARIAEHLRTDDPSVIAHGFTSPLLRSVGETTIKDELRAIISDGSVTAYFTFSSQMRPQVSQFRVFGNKNGLLLDDNQHVLVRLRGGKRKSYLENFLPPLEASTGFLREAVANMRGFARGRLHMNEGMKNLMERFYAAINGSGPLPIPYRQIIVTSRIMDRIFSQLAEGTPAAAAEVPVAALR